MRQHPQHPALQGSIGTIDVRTTYADRGPQTSKPPATVSSRHDPGSPASHGYPRQTRSGVCVGQGLWVQPQASLSSAALVSVERPIEELRTALRCDVPSVPDTSSSGEGEERGGLAQCDRPSRRVDVPGLRSRKWHLYVCKGVPSACLPALPVVCDGTCTFNAYSPVGGSPAQVIVCVLIQNGGHASAFDAPARGDTIAARPRRDR